MSDYSRAYGMRYAALRYFNAAGASLDSSSVRITTRRRTSSSRAPGRAGQRDRIMIFGDDYDTRDGTCIRDYIHVVDLADAHLRALKHLQLDRGNLRCHLGTGKGFTVKEIIEAARVTGHPIPAEIVPRREGDPAKLVSGGSRARDVLGWTPARGDVRDVIRDAWGFLSETTLAAIARPERSMAAPPPPRPRVQPLRRGLQELRRRGLRRAAPRRDLRRLRGHDRDAVRGTGPAGISVEELRSRYRSAVGSATPAAFYGVLRALLADLDDPHAGLTVSPRFWTGSCGGA